MRPNRQHQAVKATIVSLWHVGFHVTRDYANYLIPPRQDNGLLITDPNFSETFGQLVVGGAHSSMDIGDKRKLPQEVDAYPIADDIIANDGLAGFGVFVCDADAPSKEELRVAQAILLRRARMLIQEGDTKFSKPQTRAEISDLNRWAVVQLEEKREWVYQRSDEELVKVALPNCPNCGVEQKILDPASCWNCSFVLNVMKARKLGVLPSEDAELVGVGSVPTRGPGGKMQPSKPKE